jgi:glycosyltransferase involved in cell wall biosynthesis
VALRIGLLGEGNPSFGLRRDVETLLWALSDVPASRAAVSFFPVEAGCSPEATVAVPPADAPAGTVAAGTDFEEWLGRLDVVVICEYTWTGVMELARHKRVRLVLIANLDWAVVRDQGPADPARWVELLRQLGRDQQLELWCKTPQSEQALRDQGLCPRLVPWSILDPVQRTTVGRSRARPRRRDAPVFLMNAGRGGAQRRRGVDIALQAFLDASLHLPSIGLVLKSLTPLEELVDAPLARAVRSNRRLRLLGGYVPRDEMSALYEVADFVLYPSRWEGFGLSLLEALHAGVPVLATDGWPMNEVVRHGRNGFVVPARQVGRFRLAPHWECEPAALAEAMLLAALDEHLWQGLDEEEEERLAANQAAFRQTVVSALTE